MRLLSTPQADDRLFEVQRLELELTSTCNLKCPLCTRNTEVFKSFKKTIPQAKLFDTSIIDTFPTRFPNLKSVTIAGPTSEPTLHPNLLETINKLFRMGYYVELFINGTNDIALTRKLGWLFRNNNGRILFTMCGSTQELHEKYRKGSRLQDVYDHVDTLYKIIPKQTVLTWIIFEYNYQNYLDTYHQIEKRFSCCIEVFHTLPVKEFYSSGSLDLKTEEGINLIPELSNVYNTIDISKKIPENLFETECKSFKNKFRLMDSNGGIYLCSLNKYYGTSKCHECHPDNIKILRDNKINTISESEDSESEKGYFI